MHTKRRTFPRYPVALAITLSIAPLSHAQLCLTTSENAAAPSFIVQTRLSPPLEKSRELRGTGKPFAAMPSPADEPLTTPQAEAVFASGPSPGRADAKAPSELFRPLRPTIAAVANPSPSDRARDELVRKLLVVAVEPGFAAGAGLEPAFAE